MAPDVALRERQDPKILAVSGQKVPRVVALANQKGGVGKTTTAINLGAALAERGCQVLLVDLDPQANTSSGLGVDPRRARLSVYELLLGEARVDEVALASSVPGLFLVPSTPALAGAEIELAAMPERELRLRNGLADLAGGYGLVLIDCPPSLGLLTLNALAAATEMLIPMQSEYFAMEGLGHMLYTQRLIRVNLNPELELGGILVTQFDGRTALAWQVLAELRRTYPDTVFRTLIPRNVRVSEAPSHGLPVTTYDPACRGAIAYRQLAEEVLSR
jgi:chromosome partitioning protein